MPQNAFNIGRDATLVLVVNGAPVAPKGVTGFDWKEESTILQSDPLNGRRVFQKAGRHYSGTFNIDRTDSILDDYFADEGDAYYSGQKAYDAYILHTIKDANTGALSQYRFENVVLEMEDGGSYKQDAKVEQRLKWTAGSRRKVL